MESMPDDVRLQTTKTPSRQLSRRQSSRQLEATSRMNLGRQLSRVSKTTSAGNSPRAPSRSQSLAFDARTRQVPPVARYSMCLYPDQTAQKAAMLQQTEAERPTTWHVSSQRPEWQHPQAHRHASAMSQQHNVPWNDPPVFDPRFFERPQTPSLYPCSQDISPVAPISPFIAPSEFRQLIGAADPRAIYPQRDPCPGHPYPGQDPAKFEQGYDPFVEDFQLPGLPAQPWANTIAFPTGPSSEPVLSNAFLSTQQPHSSPVRGKTRSDKTLQHQRKVSRELIGMGLYEPPDARSSTALRLSGGDSFEPDIADSGRPAAEGVGKGLTLEETWRPPSARTPKPVENWPTGDAFGNAGAVGTQLEEVVDDHPANLEGTSFLFDCDAGLEDCHISDVSVTSGSSYVHAGGAGMNDVAWL
ncbi:MAG: hypothetical protein M1832_004300 [Thelocarpon impressellum]|nr:MAG: hypothetical protein M1832_004300 [Thelocarpon impressellum]